MQVAELRLMALLSLAEIVIVGKNQGEPPLGLPLGKGENWGPLLTTFLR